MTTDRDKLTTFFYLLTGGTDDFAGIPWGEALGLIGASCEIHDDGVAPSYEYKTGARFAREMVDRLLGPDPAEAEPVLDPGWPLTPGREVEEMAERFWGIVSKNVFGRTSDPSWPPSNPAWATGVREGIVDLIKAMRPTNAMGWLDAEAIIRHDSLRPVPAFADVHDCIRAIADKPHKAPQYISDLLDQARSESETRAPSRVDRERRETLLAAAETLSVVRGWVMNEANRRRIAELIDRCNLAAIADGGVVRSEPDEPQPGLRTMAARWLEAGREYWHALGDEFGRRAVVWCDDTSGALTIYTRGEYADQLRAAIPTEGSPRVHHFEPERRWSGVLQPVQDEPKSPKVGYLNEVSRGELLSMFGDIPLALSMAKRERKTEAKP
jgi:hypothetical protein